MGITGYKLGLVVFAAGDGSRLNCRDGKAFFTLPTVGKSFIELLCLRLKSFMDRNKAEVKVAFMFHPKQQKMAEELFIAKDYFDLEKENIDLFYQSTLPILNDHFHPLIHQGQFVFSADGNGSFYKSFCDSEIFDKWKKNKIESVYCTAVDNPLVEPISLDLLEAHINNKADLSVLAIKSESPNYGRIIDGENGIIIKEYTEKGLPLDAPANINNFIFSLNFIKKSALVNLPYKLIKKKFRGKIAYKFEKYWFDVLPLPCNYQILISENEDYGLSLKSIDQVNQFEKLLLQQEISL